MALTPKSSPLQNEGQGTKGLFLQMHVNRILLNSARTEIFFSEQKKKMLMWYSFSKAFCSERKHGLVRGHRGGQLWFAAPPRPLPRLVVSPWARHWVSVMSLVEQGQSCPTIYKSTGSSLRVPQSFVCCNVSRKRKIKMRGIGISRWLFGLVT